VFESLRKRKAVTGALREARVALGLTPLEEISGLQQRLVLMWQEVKSAGAGLLFPLAADGSRYDYAPARLKRQVGRIVKLRP
jgi:hypothetical protein